MNLNLLRCRKLISSFTLKNSAIFSNEHNLSSRFSLLEFFSSKSSVRYFNIIENDLINRHGLSPETALKASPFITSIPNFRSPKKSYSILAFLEQTGFSNTQLEKIIYNFPDLFASDLDNTLKPRIKFFQDSGFTLNDIAEILSYDPLVLVRSIDRGLLPWVIALKCVHGTSMDVSEVLLKLSESVLKYHLEKTLIPNIDLLISCGLSKSQVIFLIFGFQRFFFLKPDYVKDCINEVKELGYKKSSKIFISAILALTSTNELGAPIGSVTQLFPVDSFMLAQQPELLENS